MSSRGTKNGGIRNEAMGRALIAALLLLSSPAFSAEAKEKPEWDKVCAPVLKQAEQMSEDEIGSIGNRLSLCQAAESAKKTASTNGAIWKVWAGVATVCTAACAASVMADVSQPLVCMGTSAAGALTEGMMEKKMADALLMIAGTTGGAFMLNKMAAPPESSATEGKASKDFGACLLSIAAMTKALGKRQAMLSSQDAYEQNLIQAAKLDSEQSVPNSAQFIVAFNQSGDHHAYGSSTSVYHGNETNGDSCDDGGSTNAVIDCATSNDPSLPPFVRKESFGNEVAQITGQDLNGAFSGSGSGASALAQGMGQSFSTQAQKDAVKKLALIAETQLMHGVEGTNYVSKGGSSRPSTSDSAAPDLNKFMDNMMGKIFGEEAGQRKGPEGSSLTTFGQRQPASVSEVLTEKDDLFQRVTHRYQILDLEETTGGRSHVSSH